MDLQKGTAGPPVERDLPRLVQELQIHQVELELQNEELARTRSELQTLLGQYTDLYDFAPVSYFTLSRSGTILRVNVAGAALLEMERPQLVGRRFVEFVSPDGRPGAREFLSKACDAASALTWEGTLSTGAQRTLRAEIEAVASADGQGCRAAVLDTTERHRAEAAREVSEARYRLLFESSTDGLMLVDALNGVVIAANRSLCDLLGHPPEFFAARLLWDLGWMQAVASSRQAFLELQKKGDAHFDHLSFAAADGRYLEAEMFSHTYAVADGYIMQLTIRDIGEKLRSARALREMQQQLDQAQRLEAVGRLAGGIAHEFNNKLGVIIGYLDLLRRGGIALEPDRLKLDHIERAAQHCAGLTQQLLAFARKQMLRPEVLAPSTLLSALAPRLSQLVGGVEVRLEPRARGLVRADPCQLERVVMSLAANARDAMPNGGRLIIETVDVDLRREDVERPEVMPPGRYVTITVSDTGAGLDSAAQARMFDPFFTTKPVGEGTGLSLAAVYGTVKQSGGYLFVESSPGRGTSFRIYLPREESAGPA